MDTIQVKLSKVSEQTREFTLPEDATVRDLLTAAGYGGAPPDGYQARVGSCVVELDHRLEDGDVVVLVAKVSAGQ